MPFSVSEEDKRHFKEKGYVLIRGLLQNCEVEKIKTALEGSDAIKEKSFGIPDDKDRKSRLCVWSHPGNDVTGMLARSKKVAGTAEKLLGDEVYHYHSKLMMKEARTGGSFVWHQDYGYWYNNGIIYPDMITVFMALDAADTENGCLEVLEGSHRCGRVDHLWVAGQTGADPERVKLIESRCTHRYIVMEPGDAIFFHGNLLHKSNVNDSNRRRWALICAYNRLDNNSLQQHHHPPGKRLDMVDDTAIMDCTCTDLSGKGFMDPTKVTTIKLEA